MIRRSRRTTSRRLAAALVLATALALLAQATALVGSASAIQLLDPCVISPDECATIVVKPQGNGTGSFNTLTGYGQGIDRVIACGRSGGVTSGTCSHTWFVGAGKTKTISYEIEPGYQNKSCPTILTCTSKTVFKDVVLQPGLAPYTFQPNFVLDWPETLSVSSSIAGVGTFVTSPVGIDCPSRCSADFNYATDITLWVSVPKGYVFRGWSLGPCRGQGTECHWMIGTDTPVVAILEPDTPVATPTPTPHPTAKPTATPKATATPRPTATTGTEATPAGTATPSTTQAPDMTPAPTDAPAAADPTPGATSTGAGAGAGQTAQPAPTAEPGAVAGGGTDAGSGAGAPVSRDTVAIVLAIVLAGLLIAVGVAVGQRRRSADPAPARAS
jgi:hypothetical protein